MKKILATLTIVLAALAVNAQPPAGDAKPGDTYGEKITADGAVKLDAVAKKLFAGAEEMKDIKVKATVVDVCAKKGCWMTLQLEDGSTATVKMKDYAFFIPTAAKGKTVVIDGAVKLKTTSVEELRHYAEDAKKSKEEIEAITEPKKEIRVMADGVVVVE